jgi:hypothetical protein
MPIDLAEIICRNPDCRVSETGKCIEGFTTDDCPEIARDAQGSESLPVEASSSGSEKPEDLVLPKSERLSIEEASAILRSGPAVVVTIVGPTDSGKTSLIASLCELYQIAVVGSWQFARARTLFAFEQACHDARAASLRNAPKTEHTPLGSLGFYHLTLQNNTSRDLINLLMADRSGEEYRSVADDISAAAMFLEVHRADLITILVNGELLLDMGARHNIKHEVGMILQGLIDGSATSPHQRIALVLTKFDTIARASSSDKERAERDFQLISRDIQNTFGRSFREILPFQTAASPSAADCDYGYGIPDLLRFWMSRIPVPPLQGRVFPRAERAMGRFLDIPSNA